MKLFHLLHIMNTLASLFDLDLSGCQITRSRATLPLPTPTVPPPTTFNTYLQRLDSTINTNVFCLSETFQTNPQIIAASDRYDSSSIRAYGWICSLPHGQCLTTNHGPVFGRLPSSFHAEAYGLLSYLRFLYRVGQYTQSPLPKQTILYTDSASLIAKIVEIEKWLYFFPNTTMDPDWDIPQQIMSSLRLFPSLPEIRFCTRMPRRRMSIYYLVSSRSTQCRSRSLSRKLRPQPKQTPNNCNHDSRLNSFSPPVIWNYHHQI